MGEYSMILGVLQARVSSSRLPVKVMKTILGTPMILLQIERLKQCRRIDRLVVATSTEASDDPLVRACESHGITIYRGSLSDVLSRFVGAAQPYQPTAVVRLTGDCPLADAQVIDFAIETYLSGGYDYLSNVDPPTYPDGLDVEVVSYRALLEANDRARLPSEREHVTPYIRNHPEQFRLGSVKQSVDQSALRWTVDNPEDFEFVRLVYEALYPSNPLFGTADILALMDRRPELVRINRHVPRNAGLVKSLAADEEWTGRHGS
jgi:spore coat polysaccharide biosynthesis protein SpsF